METDCLNLRSNGSYSLKIKLKYICLMVRMAFVQLADSLFFKTFKTLMSKKNLLFRFNVIKPQGSEEAVFHIVFC